MKHIIDIINSKNTKINEKLVINKNIKIGKHHYHPKDKKELQVLVKQLIGERGEDANLNDIDTSEITDMSYLFEDSSFNGDISKWDVSNVKNMQKMFANSNFDGDISNWNISKVENIQNMFTRSKFNGDISKWDISNVKYIAWAFDNCPLEKNPPKWYKKS